MIKHYLIMKNITLFFVALFSYIATAQELKITPEGVAPLVISAEGQTANQLYEKAKLYIAKKYKNPHFVTKADEPGQLLRFTGYEFYKGGLTTEGDYNYTCELEFKDGRYRISFFNMYRNAIKIKDIFNKDGQVRKMKAYQTYLYNFENAINTANAEIKSALLVTYTTTDW